MVYFGRKFNFKIFPIAALCNVIQQIKKMSPKEENSKSVVGENKFLLQIKTCEIFRQAVNGKHSRGNFKARDTFSFKS